MNKENLSITFLGDVMLNNHWSDSKNSPFSNEIVTTCRDADLLFLNLESMVKGNKGENELKVPRVSTTEEAVENLQELSPSIINIANNHVYDQLYDGYIRSMFAIRKIGAKAVGVIDGSARCDYKESFILNGKKVILFTYVDPNTHPNLPNNAKVELRCMNFSNLKKDFKNVQKDKKSLIVVSVHWGLDNNKLPSPELREFARLAIDLGADIVWGHHPHVIQPIEYYNDGLIIYCQGNSCADSLNKNRILNKYQKESFIAKVTMDMGAEKDRRMQTRFLKIERRQPYSEAQVVNYNYRPPEISKMLRKEDLYVIRYKLYKIEYFIEKVWLYFFGPGKKPSRQLLKIFKRTFI